MSWRTCWAPTRRPCAGSDLIARGHGDRIHWFEDMADADRFNARAVARARRLTLRALLSRMQRARADLLDWFERLPGEALRDPSHEYTVMQWLPAPGWTHEQDHLSELRAGCGPGRRRGPRGNRANGQSQIESPLILASRFKR